MGAVQGVVRLVTGRKKDGCPVKGCKYAKKGRALKQHIELKEDEAHAKYRAANGIPEPGAASEPAALPDAAPASEAEAGPVPMPEAEAAHGSPVASDIVVELEAPPTGPLVAGDAPPAQGGGEEGEPPSEGPPARREGDEAARERGQVREYLHATAPWKAQTNRFVRGALNKWALDAEKGDRPISKEEIEEFDIPGFIEYTLDWYAREYGWDPDFDHPAVGGAMIALGLAGLVMEHRAPRQKEGERAVGAPPVTPALPAGKRAAAQVEGGVGPQVEVQEPPEDESDIASGLDAALGGAKA